MCRLNFDRFNHLNLRRKGTILRTSLWWYLPRQINFKIKNSVLQVALGTFQVLTNHMWLVAIILDSVDSEHFHHHRKFCWTALYFIFHVSTFVCVCVWYNCSNCFNPLSANSSPMSILGLFWLIDTTTTLFHLITGSKWWKSESVFKVERSRTLFSYIRSYWGAQCK